MDVTLSKLARKQMPMRRGATFVEACVFLISFVRKHPVILSREKVIAVRRYFTETRRSSTNAILSY